MNVILKILFILVFMISGLYRKDDVMPKEQEKDFWDYEILDEDYMPEISGVVLENENTEAEQEWIEIPVEIEEDYEWSIQNENSNTEKVEEIELPEIEID